MPSSLLTFKVLIKRGAFKQGFEHLARLEAQNLPLLFESYRAYLLQGNLLKAQKTLKGLLEKFPAAEMSLLWEMEQAYLTTLMDGGFAEALKGAEQIISHSFFIQAPDALKAEIERVHIRLLLTAATYYQISIDEAARARDRLPDIARRLGYAGKIDEAFAARLTYAQRLGWPDAQLALEEMAADADHHGLPNVAGEALLILADKHRKHNSPKFVIEMAIEDAGSYFRKGDHVYGPYELKVLAAKTAQTNATQTEELLLYCKGAFIDIQYYRGLLNVLMDLSSLAHQRGATSPAMAYRQELLEWSEKLGMGIAADGFVTAQIDLLMRNADFGEAIELSKSAMVHAQNPMNRALYEQLLASAYTFTHNLEAACRHGRAAIRQFEEMGAVDAASDAVLKYAADFSALWEDTAWEEAESLLGLWIEKDAQRNSLVAQTGKLEMSAQICIQKFLYSDKYKGQEALLETGETLIGQAEEIARELPAFEGAKQLANLAQLKGQIHQFRGDEEKVLEDWKEALTQYESIGLQMEAANCRYIIGVIHLNRANLDLKANFDTANGFLSQALNYYSQAGMRNQAVDARYMLALLYKNATLRQQNPIRSQLFEAALQQLQRADQDAQAIRSAFRTGASVLEIQQVKNTLRKNSHRVNQLALEITCLAHPNVSLTWDWVQKSKARALADLLGLEVRLPASIRDNEEAMALIQEEKALLERLDEASAMGRTEIRDALLFLKKKMAGEVALSEYMDLQQGKALPLAGLQSLLEEYNDEFPAVVYVDWIAIGQQIFLLTARKKGTPTVNLVSIRWEEIVNFVQFELSPESFRSNLKYVPGLLDRLNPLVQPLAQLIRPEELLIFCPTGPLYRLPLHALKLEGKLLLERNPIVYSVSSMILRHCLARRHEARIKDAALFGDALGDRPAAAAIVERLEQRFGKRAFLKEKVTKQTFLEAISQAGLAHFQGHAVHDAAQPLNSYLLLADGQLTAREIFESARLNASFVCLAACETATAQIAEGDEPQGLIPAFLFAGANTILATLWKVHEESAALCMQTFFDKLNFLEQEGVNKAQALREAVLAVRNTEGFHQPYHWAPFILYGDWM